MSTRAEQLEAARRRSLEAAGVEVGASGATVTAPQPSVGQTLPPTGPVPTPVPKPVSQSVGDTPVSAAASAYRTVGIVLYADHEKAMDKMTAYCLEAGMPGIRKGNNSSLFIGAALDHLSEMFHNDPTSFKRLVERRVGAKRKP